jgi:hypothetical protein
MLLTSYPHAPISRDFEALTLREQTVVYVFADLMGASSFSACLWLFREKTSQPVVETFELRGHTAGFTW